MGRRSSRWAAVAVALAVAAAGAAPAPAAKPRVRESVTALTPKERRDFVDAVLKLKSTPSPYDQSLSWYDQFVAWHVALYECDRTDTMADRQFMGHNGPMFLPWHRQYVLLLEQALSEVSGKEIAIPYWDWVDHDSPKSVFAPDFMGGDGDPEDAYAVKTGPFRKGQWQLNVHPQGMYWSEHRTEYLTRHLGDPGTLPVQDHVDFALAAPNYDIAPYDESVDSTLSFRNAIEGWRHGATIGPSFMGCTPEGWIVGVPVDHPQRRGDRLHGSVHGWVGGATSSMHGTPHRRRGTMNLMTSPNDPVFFLHHANIDRLWAEWQAVHGVDTYRPTGVDGDSFEPNDADDVMLPFDRVGIDVTPWDVADTRKLGYVYASSPKTRGADREALASRSRERARRAVPSALRARGVAAGWRAPKLVCSAPVYAG